MGVKCKLKIVNTSWTFGDHYTCLCYFCSIWFIFMIHLLRIANISLIVTVLENQNNIQILVDTFLHRKR